MSKILITRPRAKAEETARDLVDLGFEALVAPVLTVTAMDFDVPDFAGYQGLVFTSGQGVEIFAAALNAGASDVMFYNLPVYTVGEQTATSARAAGFVDVRSAGGDVQDLVDFIVRQALADGGTYLYVRGKYVSAPLHVLLAKHGLQVEVLHVYETVFADMFESDVMAAFGAKEIGAVVLYSTRSAQAFAALIHRHDLVEALASIKVLSISSAVLGCVQSYQWGGVYVAERPDKAGVYELIQRVCVPV